MQLLLISLLIFQLPAGESLENQVFKENPYNQGAVNNVNQPPLQPQQRQQSLDLNLQPQPEHKKLAHKPVGVSTLISDSEECATDVKRICPKSQIGSNFHTLSCIQSREDSDVDLSPECHTYVWEYRRRMSSDDKFFPMLQESCKDEMTKIVQAGTCGTAEQTNGHMASCLLLHKTQFKEGRCLALLNKMAIIVFSDYRLMSGFYQNCKADVMAQKCGSADEEEEATHSQGHVIQCLQKKYRMVSEPCKAEIRLVSELQADDFNLDRALYFACKDDRNVLCGEVPAGKSRVFNCLMEHKSAPEMSSECREAISTRQKLMIEDVKINYGLRENCLDDLQRFKDQCNYDDEDNGHSQMAKMLLCLEMKQRSGKPLTAKCVTQMKSVRKMLMSDYELNPSIVANCGDVINEHCNGMERGGKTLHCLMGLGKNSKLDETSPMCFKAIEFLIRAVNPVQDVSVDAVLMDACKPVIKRNCMRPNGEMQKDVIGCLMAKVESESMTDDCAEVLLEISYFASRDWALDRQLLLRCASDAKEKCNADKAWGTKRDKSPNGEVFACLYRHINHEDPNSRLSKQCTVDVVRVMKERAVAVGLNPHLELACRVDLAQYCSDDEVTSKRQELKCLQDRFQNDPEDKKDSEALQPECKAALRNYTKVETEEVQINRKLFHHCQPMIEKYCKEKDKEVNQGTLFKCMVEHKNEADISPICVAGIEHMQLIQLKDFSFDNRFKTACREDVRDLCADAKTKDQVVNCLSTNMRNAAVMNRDSDVSEKCEKVLKEALEERFEDVKLDRSIMRACADDIHDLCKDVKSGKARLLECLKEQKDDLSQKCHIKIFQREKEEFEKPSKLATVDYKFKMACKAMIIQYCEDEENPLRCLYKHRNEDDFDEKCAKVVESRMITKGADIRLNPAMLMKCQKDIKKHCQALIDEQKESLESKPDDFKGVIIKCLREKYVEKALRDSCHLEVGEFIKESARQWKMDLSLRTACKTYARNLCPNLPAPKVEECLKDSYLEGKITGEGSERCVKEVKRILDEGHSDIQADPVLLKTCSRDLITNCHDVPHGEGRQIGCLVESYKSKKARITADCRRILKERLEMWKMAGDSIHELENMGDLMQTIGASSSRHYFLTIFGLLISVIFFGGLLFGRVTKRVHKEMKSR